MPAEINTQTHTHLRGTGEYSYKYFNDTSVSRFHNPRDTPQTTHGCEIIGGLLMIAITWCNRRLHCVSPG
ncbi:hypothetical protein [Nostoc sp. PA-18-2419]|uniref:hypothetical protein n=1 Tax=Nostoc sp. PA-18-2419 TaxID=2575443 RepID=UPI0011E4D907|nr:hypothetical protein [Nostoc sp. PA-18-2419]